MARTSKALFAGMFVLAAMCPRALTEDIRAQTAAGAATRDSGANIHDPSATGLIHVASKQNQPTGSRSRVAPNTKPIRTPGQCFRHCLRLKGTTEGFCYASCY